jgi:ribose/xylose/arabinose/galactoside ABC-type transport system permease subunit
MSQSSIEIMSTKKAMKNGNGHTNWFTAIDPQIVGLFIALIALVALIGFRIPAAFFTSVNLLSIGEGVTLVGLTALAAMAVMVMGGLDISIGSLVGICSAAAGVAMLGATNTLGGALIGMLAAIAGGLLGGLLNGVIVTKGKIDPIIVTLGTYSAYRGIALLMTGNGYAVNVRNEAFNAMGTGVFLGIPYAILVFILACVMFHFFLEHTAPGRNIFAIGGNPVAARLAGINLDRYKLAMYTLSGLMAAVAAILYTARTKSGQPISGSEELALQAITAAILGGVSMKGGKGNVTGVLLAVLIIGTLNNGMILLSIPTFYQRVARGLLLIIAVLIQNWRIRKKK